MQSSKPTPGFTVVHSNQNSDTKYFSSLIVSIFLSDYSDVEFGVDQKKTSDILENTFRVETSSELQLKSPEETGPGLKEGGNHPPIHNLTWNIGEEVDRLMQDHKTYSSSTSSLAPKSHKQLVRQTFLAFPQCMDCIKKASVITFVILAMMWESTG